MIRTAIFIAQLAASLKQKLLGAELAVCFSQNKDELLIGFALQKEDFWIQADLSPEVSMLSFPNEYHRAKKNSVDLFSELTGLSVQNVVAHENERSFHIAFEHDFDLMFKMHGRNANLLLFKDSKLIEIFRHNLENDWKIDIAQYVYETKIEANGAIEEANRQFEEFKRNFYADHEKENILKSLKNKIQRTENYIAKTRKKLEEVRDKSDYEKIGHILMANLHLKILNQPTYRFFDFYENNEIEIKLKPEQTLQKNAENYYRKSKNRKLETDNIGQNLVAKEKLLQQMQIHLDYLTNEQDLKVLRTYAKQHKLTTNAITEQKKPEFPFLVFEIENFAIWVGKNAQNNDLLTLKYAHKEDLWLHAKDVAGSHVVIRHQSGKNFPKMVIEKAAQLAAYYSKRKTDTLAQIGRAHV